MPSKNAFTLAELLVVTAILAIVSVTAFLTVEKLSDAAIADSVKNKALASFSDLDRAVRDGKIWSYQTTFSSWALGTVTVTDFSWLSASWALVSFDWMAASGSLRVSSPVPTSWTVRFAQDNKVSDTVTLNAASANVPFRFEVGRKDAYSVSFFQALEPANRIVMRYFDRDAPLSEERARLKFVSVSASGVEYPALTVRNVLDKKEILVSGGSVPEAVLKFERGGREYLIELRK